MHVFSLVAFLTALTVFAVLSGMGLFFVVLAVSV